MDKNTFDSVDILYFHAFYLTINSTKRISPNAKKKKKFITYFIILSLTILSQEI